MHSDMRKLVADTWMPREVAPPIATPHIGGPLSFWIAAFRSPPRCSWSGVSSSFGITWIGTYICWRANSRGNVRLFFVERATCRPDAPQR